MKVLIVNASPRKGGNTIAALTEVANTLNREGIETEILEMGSKQVRCCVECKVCEARGDGRCAFDDDLVNVMNARADEFDGFVFGSPVYFGLPDGRLMSMVQRMLYCNSKAFAFKPVANIAVCRRGGATSAIEAMNMPWLMVNCPIVTSQYWNIVYGCDPGDAPFDPEGMQTMRQLARNMAWMLKSLKRDEAPQREPWIKTRFVRDDLKTAAE